MPGESRLKRAINSMPDDVRKLIVSRGLMAAYEARPDYQRNDYLGWIGRARLPATREKRINQMLNELAGGTKYMNMLWKRDR